MLDYLRTPSLKFHMSTQKRGNVLLVDGNALVTRFLTIKLQNAGYCVVLAKDAGEAKKQAGHTKQFDLVALASSILEDDREAAKELRESLGCPVMAYGFSQLTFQEQQQLHLDYYFERFIEPDDFLKAIELAISRKKAF